MDVIATRVGTYPAGRARDVGERFTLADKGDLGSWMAPVDSEEAKAGIARQREPLATPARAETGPNPAIASAYAEAGLQTTALLLELQEARVALGEAKTRANQLEAELARFRAESDDLPATDVKAAKADLKRAEAARQVEAEALDEAVKAAEEAQGDQSRSEEPEHPDAEEAAKAPENEAEEAPAPAPTGRRRRLTP